MSFQHNNYHNYSTSISSNNPTNDMFDSNETVIKPNDTTTDINTEDGQHGSHIFGLDHQLLTKQKQELEEQRLKQIALDSFRNDEENDTHRLSTGEAVHFRSMKSRDIYRMAIEVPTEVLAGNHRIVDKFYHGRTGFIFETNHYLDKDYKYSIYNSKLIPIIQTRSLADCTKPPFRPNTVEPDVILHIADAFTKIRETKIEEREEEINPVQSAFEQQASRDFVSYDSTIITALTHSKLKEQQMYAGITPIDDKESQGTTLDVQKKDTSVSMFDDVTTDYIPSYLRNNTATTSTTTSTSMPKYKSLFDDDGDDDNSRKKTKDDDVDEIKNLFKKKPKQQLPKMSMGSALASSTAPSTDDKKPKYSFLQDDDDIFGDYGSYSKRSLDIEDLKKETKDLLMQSEYDDKNEKKGNKKGSDTSSQQKRSFENYGAQGKDGNSIENLSFDDAVPKKRRILDISTYKKK